MSQMRIFSGSAIALLCVACAAGPVAAAERTPTPTQLPRLARPVHYNVTIEPDAAALTFRGDVAIELEVLAPVESITFNAVDLKFSTVRFNDSTGRSVTAEPKVTMDEGAQTATVAFGKSIPSGRYWLAIDYTGKIGTQANGLFAIDYDSAAGRKRALYTQFEAPDARRMIPSWDEPEYKATFTLEAIVPQEQMAVSNMPVAERVDSAGGHARVRFQKTPKMSTYLLFFGLGEFDRATARHGETELGVVTQKGKADQAQFALDSSVRVLREYNDYFGTPYALPKLDNVAAPSSSRFFGAMENWGAILTFEYVMLLDPSISTQADKQSVFAIAAHEIAHQWFGDLVTMQWWDDLWLNEGFATWMANKPLEAAHPDWNVPVDESAETQRAFGIDSLAATRPIQSAVSTPAEIDELFDPIAYEKGAAVLRMVEHYAGADAFKNGINAYLQAHAYKNATSEDFWKAISATSGKPVERILPTFVNQPGVPLLEVEELACNAGKTETRATFTQSRFSLDGKSAAGRWQIPVCVTGPAASGSCQLLTEPKQTLPVANGCASWFFANAGARGYYRTAYSPAMLRAMAPHIAGTLTAAERLSLINDEWALVRAGRHSVADFLTLVTAFGRERASVIVTDIAD